MSLPAAKASATGLASWTRPSASTTTSALDAASKTRRIRLLSGAVGAGAVSIWGVVRPSVSTMAAMEPITCPYSFSIGMAVTETSMVRRLAGLASMCWKPLTV